MRNPPDHDLGTLEKTVAGWKQLKSLRAKRIELGRALAIRLLDLDALRDPERVISLIQDLGLNDEGIEEYPVALHRYCGAGLRIWQYPIQFGRYLVDIGRLQFRSYLEVGVRHGGTFVTTVEYLERFHPLAWAVGIDLLPSPSLLEYNAINPKSRFVQMNTQSAGYLDLLAELAPLGLVFVDSFHGADERRAELTAVIDLARAVAVHDIAHEQHPELGTVWNELKSNPLFECREYVEQYPGLTGSFMGIGLAVRR